jgi:hypothetical protein
MGGAGPVPAGRRWGIYRDRRGPQGMWRVAWAPQGRGHGPPPLRHATAGRLFERRSQVHPRGHPAVVTRHREVRPRRQNRSQPSVGYSAENSEAFFIRGGARQCMSYCWRTPKSRKFHPVYRFFEHRERRKSRAERSDLGIEIGWPTVTGGFVRQDSRGVSRQSRVFNTHYSMSQNCSELILPPKFVSKNLGFLEQSPCRGLLCLRIADKPQRSA